MSRIDPGDRAEQLGDIALQGVGVVFPAPDGPVRALQDVTLTVESREFVSLLGPSGCGKSTLLRLVADIVAPTEGRITISGQSPAVARQRRLFGFVFQDPTLLAWRSALQNVLLPLEITGEARGARATAVELLELVGLKGFENAYPWQLSGGMRQRVAIARALITRPAILLMDEPFGALDEITRERMNQELLWIWERTATTVVFVTHSATEAVFLSDRVIVLSARPGRIKRELAVSLPRPRDPGIKETTDFTAYTAALRHALAGEADPA